MLEAHEPAQRPLARIDEWPAGGGAERFDPTRDIDCGERLLDDDGVLLADEKVERDATGVNGT